MRQERSQLEGKRLGEAAEDERRALSFPPPRTQPSQSQDAMVTRWTCCEAYFIFHTTASPVSRAPLLASSRGNTWHFGKNVQMCSRTPTSLPHVANTHSALTGWRRSLPCQFASAYVVRRTGGWSDARLLSTTVDDLYLSDRADVRYLAGPPPRFPCRKPPDGLDKSNLPVLQARFRHFSPPPVCFHLAGPTFNSSHSQVRKADRWPRHWSLMRGRTLSCPRSGTPVGITAGSLSARPNNPCNAAFRPTLPFKRHFCRSRSLFFFFPCFPPVARDCVLNH